MKATNKELLQWLRAYALESDHNKLVAAVERVAAKGFRLRGATLYEATLPYLEVLLPGEDLQAWAALRLDWKAAVDGNSYLPLPMQPRLVVP